MSKKGQNKPEINIPVPPEGNLGLLAYGYKGLLAWRQARNASQSEKKPGGVPEE